MDHKGHPPSTPWLERVEVPSEPVLIIEDDDRGIGYRVSAENRLPGERRHTTGRFPDLLKLSRSNPVHLQRCGKRLRDIAIAAPPAEHVDLLQHQDIGIELAKNSFDKSQLGSAKNIPRHNSQRMVRWTGHMVRQFADDLMNAIGSRHGISEMADKPQHAERTGQKGQLAHDDRLGYAVAGSGAGERSFDRRAANRTSTSTPATAHNSDRNRRVSASVKP